VLAFTHAPAGRGDLVVRAPAVGGRTSHPRFAGATTHGAALCAAPPYALRYAERIHNGKIA
jgi:hypothetical protein